MLKGLEGLVTSPGGPPGAIATLYRNGKLTTLSTGRADIEKSAKPRATDHMRIASVAKAFSGAVALHLVREGKLALDDTIAKVLPTLPSAWGAVTLEQLLHHTSGLPDYTKSDGFIKQAETDPRGYVSPQKVIGWVAKDPLVFKPDIEVRVLEHRQHRGRADGRSGDRATATPTTCSRSSSGRPS